jgi:TetR/AcrR family transcriptional regulator
MPRPTSPPRTHREAQTEATRAVILDAAEQLFAAHGFAGTSMRAVAAQAGTSQALLHHHFGTKDGLYEQVKRRFTDLYEALQPPGAADLFGVPFLRDTLVGYLRFLRAHPAYHRIRHWARLEGDERPWGEEDAVWQRMHEAVQQGQALGLIDPDLDPSLFLGAAAAAIAGWLDQRALVCRALDLDPHDPDLDRRYVEQTLHTLLHGVATPALSELLHAR